MIYVSLGRCGVCESISFSLWNASSLAEATRQPRPDERYSVYSATKSDHHEVECVIFSRQNEEISASQSLFCHSIGPSCREHIERTCSTSKPLAILLHQLPSVRVLSVYFTEYFDFQYPPSCSWFLEEILVFVYYSNYTRKYGNGQSHAINWRGCCRRFQIF